MKKLFSVLVILTMYIGAATAQNFVMHKADSLVNGDTISYIFDARSLKDARYSATLTLTADSVSGSNRTANAYLQVTNSTANDDWHTIRTIVITSSGVQKKSVTTDTIAASRFRVYMISGGTQKTTVKYGVHATKL